MSGHQSPDEFRCMVPRRRRSGRWRRRECGSRKLVIVHPLRVTRHFSRAFTLIELMVVLVLIGILTAVMIPEMRGSYEDAMLRSTSRELINVCHLAYSQAVSLNQVHR